MAAAKSCRIVVGTVRGTRGDYPLNQNGWAAALREARRVAEGPGKWLALVDLECGGGRVAMYQCSENERGRAVCGLESVGDPDRGNAGPPIAGRRTKRRRRR